jgi:transcription elongation factor GreA
MSSTPITLGQALAEYLQAVKPEVRRTHEQPVRRFVEYHSETTLLSSLTGSHIERYAEQQISSTDPAAGDRVQALKAWFVYLKKREYTQANLGIHIRTRRVQARTGAALRNEDQPVEMTRSGFETLQGELQHLETQRAELRQAVEIARSDGDLRENAPYHAAREALALVDSRVRQIEQSLKRATIVERATGDRASVGSVVKVLNLEDDKTFEYRLVSPREANAAERKISVESPVGKELLGRSPGDEVVVTTPRGAVRFRVEAVGAV